MPDKVAVPTQAIENTAAATIKGVQEAAATGGADFGLAHMFMQADIVVKFVIVLLLLSSVWSWAIIFDKVQRIFVIRRRMDKFEDTIWTEPLEARFNRAKDNPDHPMAKVFVVGMYEWIEMKKRGLLAAVQRAVTPSPARNGGLVERIRERMLQAMDSIHNKEIASLERNLGFLATVGSTAPFVGLFGTVYGIMNSFQSIALTKNTTLSVVAPGIAEALFATAVGLFAAIPAVIFYNKFSNEIADISDRINHFSDDFVTTVSREVEEHELGVKGA